MWDSGYASGATQSDRQEYGTEKLRVAADSQQDQPRQRFGNGHSQDLENIFENGDVIPPKTRISGFETERSRYNTYINWPVENIVTSKELARFGLIYTGTGDRVKCVFCLGAMYNWDIGDDAIQEHTRHFPECPFILYFVRSVIDKTLQFYISLNTESGDNTYTLSYVLEKWNELPSVIIVHNLGYSYAFLEKAKRLISQKFSKGINKHFCQVLIDIVYELEKENSGYDTSLAGTSSQNNFEAINEPVSENTSLEQHTESQTESVSSEISGAKPKVDPKHLPTKEVKEREKSVDTLSPELKKLVLENKELRKNTYCNICNKNEANMLFLPCRHISTCDNCSAKLRKCNRCHKDIIGTIKIYMG